MRKPITVAEIAKRVGGLATGDVNARVTGPADLASAAPGEISFLANVKYAKFLAVTKASAVILGLEARCDRKDLALIRVANPNAAFTRVIEIFAPPAFDLAEGVHPQSSIANSAKLGVGVGIGPFVVIGEDVEIGAGTKIHAGCFVGPGAKTGKNCVLFPGVNLLDRVTLGDRVRIMSGTVIGSDGFGYEFEKGHWSKIPQSGMVTIEDDVEIGANCAIDRARFGTTRIGRGTKIDNLVHVAHNVQVGHDSLLIAQAGIAGSAMLGHHVIVAGQAGVGGHVHVGDGAKIAGGSGITSDVEPGSDVWGMPHLPFDEFVKAQARVRKLGETMKKLRDLEKRVEGLEKPALAARKDKRK